MKIEGNGTIIYLDDNCADAKKIMGGHPYEIVADKVIIKELDFDFKTFTAKLEKQSATIEDIQEYILKVLIKK